MAPFLFRVVLHEPQLCPLPRAPLILMSPALGQHAAVLASLSGFWRVALHTWWLPSQRQEARATWRGESLPRTEVRSLVLPFLCHSSQDPSHIHCQLPPAGGKEARSPCRRVCRRRAPLCHLTVCHIAPPPWCLWGRNI